jgi:outer membrane beta-barrel protein
MKTHLRSALVVAVLLGSSGVRAQELIESVVVRNRLYEPKGRFELGLQVGLTLSNRLTYHCNPNLDLSFNLSQVFALELQAGYAFSDRTDFAKKVVDEVNGRGPRHWDDLPGLWRLNANAILGVAWGPIYGKISLLSELPVHFQAYLWLGGGAAGLTRESVVDCDGAGMCAVDSRIGPVLSAAFGLRFYATEHLGLRVELRDYGFLDSYREGIDASAPVGETGTAVANPGITQVVVVNFGAQFLF